MECNYLTVKYHRLVRCNECSDCIKYKKWIWTQRIKVECINQKNWFLTLTYKGQEKDGYRDVQLMLKRLRKKYSFRFMCKSELQKRGVVHYHLAVHGDLTRRQVESEWKFGFKNAKLMNNENQIARYIAKYITKDERKGKNYRASIRYGLLKEEITKNDMVKKAMAHFPDSRVIKVFDNEVGSISLPWKYQHKNSPEERKRFILINEKTRKHASLGGTRATRNADDDTRREVTSR